MPEPQPILSLKFRLSYSLNIAWLSWLSLSMAADVYRYGSLILMSGLIYLALFVSPLRAYLQRYFLVTKNFYRLVATGWVINACCLLALLSSSSAFGLAFYLLPLLAIAHLILMIALLQPLANKLVQTHLRNNRQER